MKPNVSARLANKIAVITGGNSGIGRATAQRFLAEGARVVITGRNRAAIDETVVALSSDRVSALKADAGSPTEMEHVFAAVAKTHGKIDVLFLNAGIAPVAPLASMSEAAYDELFATNVKGVFFAVQKALPHLAAGASIVINSSAANAKGMPGFVAYAGTKAAVRSFARGMSAELAAQGVRVNTVSPGPITTPLWSKAGLTPEQAQGVGAEVVKNVPAGRFGTVDEIANAVVYRASDESRYVVGADL